MPTAEHARLAEINDDVGSWRKWGPYLSDRAWGTVREDYSSNGDAWNYLSHDQARSTAYRWGEDGIAGLCDRYQILCLAPAVWNGADAILKERLFGLTPHLGNHGEDVKEYYFYLDSTPTHSYMRCLYKYPQQAFPYQRLNEENQRRGGQGLEFELLDTGIFDEDRYFDLTIEYAKDDAEDIVVRIEAVNRGPRHAPLHIVPQLWFRNTWSWQSPAGTPPQICAGLRRSGSLCLLADDTPANELASLAHPYHLGPRALYASGGAELMFTDNESRWPHGHRQSGHAAPGQPASPQFAKDAFHRRIIGGEQCTNPAQRGSKAALHYRFDDVPPGGSVQVALRLTHRTDLEQPLATIDELIGRRRAEADEYYDSLHAAGATVDERRIQRQAWAGLLWSKQCYFFDVGQWLDGDAGHPSSPERRTIRNQHWRHLNSMRVMAMPDKWEYPWFAAWDLAFHCVALAVVDPQYAMDQLWLLLFEQFQHPNGQLPAYEWEFSDINPPVHAWAVWRVYNMARLQTGKADRVFLERCFHKLLLNFTWWINRVDSSGNNIFEGGFLGLDNITVVDRSQRAGDGAVLEQSDATGWMGMFCLNLMRIALELAHENPAYEALATKFFQHYTYVAAAMKHVGGRDYQLWDETDGFFYDVLRYPDGRFCKFRVRSLVGLIPLFAVERLEEAWIAPFKEFRGCLEWFLRNRSDLAKNVVHTIDHADGQTHLLTIVNQDQLRRMLGRMWDPAEFLSDYGVRSLSKYHQQVSFELNGALVEYEPAESVAKLKGGNSNWRGPVWFPTCFLMIESLRKLTKALGPDFTIPCPGGQALTPQQMAAGLAERLIAIFARDSAGRRPVYGGSEKFQRDPHWRDLILFYEYFHGENGAGLGASHQTGWTALVASLIDEWRK
jgi:hypothetical protein